jgi:hypothetical protein
MLGSRKNSTPVNLQSSNSFKSLLESKNRTPPRLGSMALTHNKKQSSGQSSGSLRSSLCSNNLNGLQSDKKMIDSRSNEKISSIRSPQKMTIPLCKNEDGNKVKIKNNAGEVQSGWSGQ